MAAWRIKLRNRHKISFTEREFWRSQSMQMFTSNRKPEPTQPAAEAPRPVAAQPPPNRPAPAATPARSGGLLSSGVSIKGSVKFQKELLIDGEVEGAIESPGTLTIGKQARIRGEVRVKAVIVQGTVDGNITASERCELQAGCTLRGDIEAPRLVVDENATFFGSAKIATKPA
jgi:cytoskeletal protein CcmA (bactofilin family)